MPVTKTKEGWMLNALVGLIAVLMAAGQTQAPKNLRQVPAQESIEQQALKNLQEIVAIHPDPQLKKDFADWNRSGKVVVYVGESPTKKPYKMMVILFVEAGKSVPMLLISPGYINTPLPNVSQRQDRLLKGLVLSGMYINLRAHLDGKFLIRNAPDPAHPKGSKVAEEEFMDYLWEKGFRATQEQWRITKLLNSPSLMPDLARGIEKYGEKSGMLKAYCDGMAQNEKNFPPGPEWQKKCGDNNQEIARLTARNMPE